MKKLVPALIVASLLWPLLSPPAQAEDGPYYLVEVIVLTHSAGRPDGHRIDQLDDFNALTDPVRLARLAELEIEQGLPEPDLADEFGDTASRELPRWPDSDGQDEPEALATGPTYPERFVNQPELSPAMQRAWDRLANSGEFQPRVWRAWYQPLSRTRLSPQVRIRDENKLRVEWDEPDETDMDFSPQDEPRQQLPDRADYRLDGGLRLRQRQFMHVDLDLVWREAIEQESLPSSPLMLEGLPGAGYRQHRLNQSRTVRPERLEYFDSSWLGVLVRIQRWEPPEQDQVQSGEPGSG